MSARVEPHQSPCITLQQTREQVAAVDQSVTDYNARLEGMSQTLRTILQVCASGLIAGAVAVGILVANLLARGAP